VPPQIPAPAIGTNPAADDRMKKELRRPEDGLRRDTWEESAWTPGAAASPGLARFRGAQGGVSELHSAPVMDVTMGYALVRVNKKSNSALRFFWSGASEDRLFEKYRTCTVR